MVSQSIWTRLNCEQSCLAVKSPWNSRFMPKERRMWKRINIHVMWGQTWDTKVLMSMAWKRETAIGVACMYRTSIHHEWWLKQRDQKVRTMFCCQLWTTFTSSLPQFRSLCHQQYSFFRHGSHADLSAPGIACFGNSIGWFRWRRWSTKEGRDSENWCVYMCLSFVPKFFNFVWGSRLPSPRILNEAGVWVEGLDIFLINHESAKDKCECPGKNCCGDDSLVCDVKTRTCKPSLGSVCSTSYFFTECASKDTYNVSTECALSAAGYHRCCIKSGQPLALTTYTDECCWGKKGNVCKWDPDGFLGNDSVPSTWARSRRKTLAWQRFSRNTSRIHRFKSCHTFHLVCFIFWSAQIFKSVSHTFHLFCAVQNVVLICFVRALDFSQHEK